MFKLLIVEDEPLIRLGLQHYFSWQELNVGPIVEADNGKDGYLTALREQPDLVITDIRMPEMDGLQMIEQIRLALPETLFIILTGFNDFQYAQKAIQIGGVHDFLLKPLEYETSLATIQSCMQKLEQKRKDRHNRMVLEEEAKENSMLRGNQIVKLLLEEADSEIDETMIAHLCGFQSENKLMYIPFVMTWLPRTTAHSSFRKSFKTYAESLINDTVDSLFPNLIERQVFIYIYKSKLYGIVIFDEQKGNHLENLEQAQLNDSITNIELAHSISLFMAIGSVTSDLSKMHQLLHDTDKTLYQRFYQPNRSFFLAAQLDHTLHSAKVSYTQLDDQDKKRIIDCIESVNAEEIKQLMQRLAQDILRTMSYAPPEKWLAFLQEVIGVIIRFANKNDIPIEGVYSEKLLNLTCVDDFPTLEALFDWLGSWMVHLGIVYKEGATDNRQQDVIIFEHIEAFIRQHIDQDITLQMVADRFFYNPSYLSRLFKIKLNKNYMRFVTEIRMGYAQECLKNPDLLVTDVCTMCGYKSYKHFVKTFRIITNMTPTDYRKKSGW